MCVCLYLNNFLCVFICEFIIVFGHLNVSESIIYMFASIPDCVFEFVCVFVCKQI